MEGSGGGFPSRALNVTVTKGNEVGLEEFQGAGIQLPKWIVLNELKRSVLKFFERAFRLVRFES